MKRLLDFTALEDIDLARLMLDAANEIHRLQGVIDEQSATIRHLATKMERMMR